MPTMTMSLPHQAPGNVFRQPLVLCSSGQLNSAQSLSYSAAPIPRIPTLCSSRRPAGGCASTAPALAGHSSCSATAAPVPRHGSSSSKKFSKPSPFATKGGQAVATDTISETLHGAIPPSPFLDAAASLPSGSLLREEPLPWSSAVMQSQLQWQDQGVIQGWSSLPAAGLRTCSSLQQLHLHLSGAPPTPQDLEDLSKLPNLTHLSFRQVEGPAVCPAVSWQAAGEASHGMAAGQLEGLSAATIGAAEVDVMVWKSVDGNSFSSCSNDEEKQQQVASASGLAPAIAYCQRGATSSSEDSSFVSVGCSRSSSCSSLEALVSVNDSVGTLSSLEQELRGHRIWGSSMGDRANNRAAEHGSSSSSSRDAAVDATSPETPSDQASAVSAAAFGFSFTGLPSQCTECVSCSVITPQHVAALAKLPHLSSLELHPKQGSWHTAATAALLQLTMLTGLTRLSLTWGDAAGVHSVVQEADAAQLAHGEQLVLQQCLYGLGSQLQELELKGCAVMDIVVLQRMQKLRKLQAEALKIVNSDVVQRLQQAQAAAAAGLAVAPAHHHHHQQQQADVDAQPAAAPDQQQQRRSLKWATLPVLESLHVVHPASDISILLQGTQTPALSELGFVTHSPSDFARLLGQHGKLKVLHLVFPQDEPWHPIAVVRLPTALPSLRSLTLVGKFWLPNSLIVALGVMDVPIEELSLTCKLAPPCLERLQHLQQLKKLVLHHVAWLGHPADGLVTKDVMLQLPAKLLPAGLRELEISNGWILH